MANPSVTVRVNLSEFQGELATLADRVRARIQRGMNVGLRRLQTFIVDQELAGQILHRRTRKLVRSVRLEPAAFTGDRIAGAVLAGGGPAWYGRLHEYGGLKAYTIVPRHKKALAFMAGGQTLIRRSVTHPPLKARPFMRPALEAETPVIVDAIREELQR